MEENKYKKRVVKKTRNKKKDLHGNRYYEGLYSNDSMENTFPIEEQQESFNFEKWFRGMRNFL